MKSNAPRRNVIVLDRDGTIVIDRHYLDDPAKLEFLPGAAQGLRRLYDGGYRLVVITNQSGIGRGFFTLERLHEIHRQLTTMVNAAGVELEGIYACPHLPNAGCSCRKPELGLLQQAAAELSFDLSNVIVVGDKASDVEFGRRAGAPTLFVRSGTESESSPAADFVVRDLVEAAAAIEACNASAPP